jgi:hypothetical protein
METIFGWLFSGAWAWFMGKIGMSPEEKLGRAEVTNAVLTNDLKEKTHEAEVFEAPARSEPVVIDDMLKHAGK